MKIEISPLIDKRNKFQNRIPWWTVSVFILAGLVCSTIAYLHFQQLQTLNLTTQHLNNYRQARLDLAEGFIKVSLSGDGNVLFSRSQGVALLDQALNSSEEQVLQLGQSEDQITEFTGHHNIFRYEIANLPNGEIDAKTWTSLWISYNQLQSDAAEIDQNTLASLDAEKKQLTEIFRWAIFVSIFLFSGIGLGIYRSEQNRYHADLRRKESETRYRRVVEDQTELICRYDKQFKLTFVNEAYARSYGMSADKILGRSVLDRIPQAEREAAIAHVKSLTALNPIATSEHQSIMPDQSMRWYQWTDRAILDESGNITEYQGVGRDITARKQVEQSLFATEQRLRLFVEHAPAAIAMFDHDMNYLLASQRWLNDYQLQETDIIGRSHYDVFPDLPDRWKEIHRRCLNGAIESNEADPFPRGDGRTDWIRWETRPWHDAHGKISGIIIFAELITERIQAERELKALYEATSALFAANNLQSLGQQIVETVVKVFDQADCGLMLLDDSSQEITRLARAGQYHLRPNQQLNLTGAGLVPRALRSGEIVYAPDVSLEPHYMANESRTKSELVIPLKTAKGVIGALDLQHLEKNAFDERDQRILKAFAERAALAIATMLLNDALSSYATDLEARVSERTSELEQGKNQVDAILNNSPDGILLLDRDLLIQQANNKFRTTFGCSDDHCFGKSLLMLIHPDNIEDVKTFIQEHLKTQNGEYLEVTAVHHDGTTFDAELSMGSIDENGLVCVIRDISERKRYERQLRYYASFQEHISDAVIATDLEFRIQSWNQAAEYIYGWAAEEVIGQTVRDVLHTQHQPGMSRETAKENLALAGEWHSEVRQKHKNGNWLDISASVSQLTDEKGVVIGSVSVNRDITEHKVYERQLQYHASLQENVSDAVVVTDMNLVIQSWNSAAERIYGWSATEAIGKASSEILRTELSPEERERNIQLLQEQGWWSGEVIQHHKDGRAIYIWGSVTIIKNEFGKPYSVIAVNHDITERKQAEKALHESEERLRTIVENIPVMVSFFDTNGRFEFVNQCWLDQVGWTVEDLTATEDPLALFYPDPDYRQRVLDFMLSAQSGWRDFNSQTKYRGERTTSWANVRLSDGRSIGIGQDITERKQAEDALQKSSAEIHDLYNNAPCGYHSIDKSGLIVQMNDTELRWLGYTRDEVVGRLKITALLTLESMLVFQRIFPVFLDHRQMNDVELDMVRKDGSIMHILLNATAIYDDDGQYLKSRSTLFDITELQQAQQTIVESESRYRLLAENIADVIMTFSLDRIITYMSPSCERLLGYLPEEVEGKSHSEFIHPEDYPQVMDRTRQAVISKENFYTNQFRLQHKAGHYIWYEVRTRLVWEPNTSGVVQFVSVLRDITERKQAEDALRESEEKFRLLLDAAPVATIISDQTGQINLVNRQAEILFGYERSELVGQMVEVLVPDYARKGHVNNRMIYVATPRIRPMGLGMELYARHKGGGNMPVEIELSYIETPEGLRVISFIMDITERKRVATELERQRVFLKEVIDESPSMIFVKDIEGRFVFVNPAMAGLFNTTVEELIGKSDNTLNIPESEINNFHHDDRRVITQGETISIEESLTLKTGEVRWLQTTKVPLFSEDGQAIHVLGISIDITERKHAELALQKALAKEKELGELKTRFVSMASHEFRTPLATILATVETLSAYRHKLSEEKIDQRFDKIKEQIAHLKAIMEDVLMLARMQARKVEFNPSRLDLDALCRSVLDEFQNRTDITHQIEYRVEGKILELMLDRKLMRQVINNLVSNAIKYSPQADAVYINLEYRDSKAMMIVRDEGIGIPEADLAHLFEPFHRATNVETISGTGLGLVIVKEAVELHGGTISVDSQVGIGTTITIQIPTTIARSE